MLYIYCWSVVFQSYTYKEPQQNLAIALYPNKIYIKNGLPCVPLVCVCVVVVTCLTKDVHNRNNLKGMLNLKEVTVYSVNMGLNL